MRWILVMYLSFPGNDNPATQIYSPPTQFTSHAACDSFAESVKTLRRDGGRFDIARDIQWLCVEVKP